jgi:hypothetical protein
MVPNDKGSSTVETRISCLVVLDWKNPGAARKAERHRSRRRVARKQGSLVATVSKTRILALFDSSCRINKVDCRSPRSRAGAQRRQVFLTAHFFTPKNRAYLVIIVGDFIE